MELYVMNQSFETIAVIDAYSSVIWTKRYFTCGDFELYLPVSLELLNTLAVGNYVYRLDDDTVMIIEKIQITTDIEKGNHLIVTGRSLESILVRRIVWDMTSFDTNVVYIIRYLLNSNVINPTIAERKINNFSFNSLVTSTTSIQKQVTGDNLMDTIVSLCTTYGFGWRIKLENGSFKFELYQGVDRSYNQTVNPYVVFSPTFDNLINSNYELDMTNYANVALVAGEGEGSARKKQTVSASYSTGINRREIYVDAKDLSTNTEQPLTESKYDAMLMERGTEKLAETIVTKKFDGDVETRNTYVYRRDWNIGDIVQIENEFGITATSRILEIIESEDESGYSVIPTFEEWEV